MSPPKNRRFVLSILRFFILGLTAMQTGLAATFLAEGYAVRVWQTEDGLPQNVVTSGVQTRDGYLWFGTSSGLVRFDGERFEVFDPGNTPGLPDRRISSLYEDAAGTLWIGTDAGVLVRYRDNRFAIQEGLADKPSRIIGLGSDAQSRIWAMRSDGTVDGISPSTRLPSLIGNDPPGILSWSAGAGGNLWLVENGKVARLEQNQLRPISLPAPRDNNYALVVAAAEDGAVWIVCDNRIRKWKEGRWVEDRGTCPWSPGPVASCRELRDGTLAIGTIHAGLYLVFRDGRPPVHFDRENRLPQNWIRFILEDSEGTLWIGAGGAGLVSILPSSFSTLNSPDQWQGCTILALAPDERGSLWVGTDGAGVYRFDHRSWQRYGESEGLQSNYVLALATGPAGEVWAATGWWGSPYLLKDGRFARPPWVTDKSSPVAALLKIPDSDGLLVGSRDGLLQMRDGQTKWLFRTTDDAGGSVCAIARDAAGVIWCGFNQGGLVQIGTDGRTTVFRRKDGLASDAVQCLCVDQSGNLWVGTADNGLTRLKDGRLVNLGQAQGLLDKAICHIEDDGRGSVWLSTHHGLQRIDWEELNRCADGAIPRVSSRTYDQSDGLPTIEFTSGLQGTGCRLPDGRLLFATSKGVISVDPKRIATNPTPPPVMLESVWVDGFSQPRAGDTMSRLLSPDHQRIEFRFSALSYVAPNKVLFKYRLDGIDDTWVDAGTKRTAFYSRLPAGDYRFRVIACNNDGVWNTAGASIAFTVAPFFWQTWWFVSASLVGAAIAIAWLARFVTRRRLQRRIAEIERQHELERERARIAQDIHDDVGASLSRIAMLSQPARADLAEPERTSALLARIYGTAREVTRALDEIVWAVDPRHDTLDSLVDYMAKFAQSHLSAAKLRCRLDLPVAVPPWPLTAETRHNLFLAFKEALSNVVKHAAASEARISFRLQADAFTLTVTDNGRGFDSADRGEPQRDRIVSGHGLPNMQTRLRRIGGRCEIASAPGAGTTVTFVVAVERARASAHAR